MTKYRFIGGPASGREIDLPDDLTRCRVPTPTRPMDADPRSPTFESVTYALRAVRRDVWHMLGDECEYATLPGVQTGRAEMWVGVEHLAMGWRPAAYAHRELVRKLAALGSIVGEPLLTVADHDFQRHAVLVRCTAPISPLTGRRPERNES